MRRTSSKQLYLERSSWEEARGPWDVSNASGKSPWGPGAVPPVPWSG